ncbi:TPA: hypothetical protein EYP26_05175, partial [Candidatus Bathyarchaeota archaeon]|nr:hypothetical protein [Candidatus Bathyarchaeota archaeon]
AEKKAAELKSRLAKFKASADILGVDNHTAVNMGDVIFLSIPYSIESKVGAAIPVKNILMEEPNLKDKVLVDVIVPTKLHTPMIIDEEDLAYYRRKFGAGKTPSVTEEIYLFAYNHLNLTPRIVGAFKTISFHRIADVRNDLPDEILIWGFEDRDIDVVRKICEDINKAEKPRIYEVPQIFWRSIEGVCEYIREQSLMGREIMALTFSYKMGNEPPTGSAKI